jgi:transposase-like protein
VDQESFDFDEQQENLERVSSRIGKSIIEFCRSHGRFHADDLRKWVIRETGTAAPASADRILRDLRRRGVIGYRVVSRRESLYEVTFVAAA